MNILFIVIILLSLLLNIFLIKEFLKKFGFWKNFQKKYKNQLSWNYDGKKKPGMYTMKIQGNGSFQTLIGFDLSVSPTQSIGYDIFGYMESSDDGTIYFSTYLAKKEIRFIFLIESISTNSINITCIEDNESIIPTYIFQPHWWQKIGLF